MADKPVIDLRIYTIRPRGMPQYLKLFEELALPLALKYLGEPLGYYVTQIGPLNQVVHLWAFENLADMEQRHAALAGDSHPRHRNRPLRSRTFVAGISPALNRASGVSRARCSKGDIKLRPAYRWIPPSRPRENRVCSFSPRV
jgi:hypothetical protein